MASFLNQPHMSLSLKSIGFLDSRTHIVKFILVGRVNVVATNRSHSHTPEGIIVGREDCSGQLRVF